MNVRHPALTLACLAMCCMTATLPNREARAEKVDFRRDIAPVLQTRCLGCHNERERRGDLSLESARSLAEGGASGEVILPGDPAGSYLLELVTPTDGAAEMPKGEEPLTERQRELLRRWIAEGAAWPDELRLELPTLWSLQPLRRPEVPSLPAPAHDTRVTDGTPEADDFPLRNPIDAFVAARHRQAQLRPAPEADRRTLIRRLYLDLTGLPPSFEAVEAFVRDEHPLAYERLVDELLSSPHFGERWGRHWLDLARYGDSDGYLGDSLRPHAWIYRTWVIDAFNRDLPFDQFSVEQLAGDLLEEPTLEQRIATGFHRNTLRNTEAGVDLELYRTKEVVDRVNTTGMVWLGLTLGCAECHDHKHDPVSQREFYQLYAFFNNADEVGVTATQPWEVDQYQRAMDEWQRAGERLLRELQAFEKEGLTAEQRDEIAEWLKSGKDASLELSDYYRTEEEPDWKEWSEKLEQHRGRKPAAPATKAPVFAQRRSDRRETFVHIRGVYNRPGEKVRPDGLDALPELSPRASEADRLDLARWLFQKDNPLTARVAANRLWQHLFGEGLVSTPNDFGNKGAKPTHPLLLDWLASEYQRLGWSRKAMIRLIVTSSTYRLSSSANTVPHQAAAGNQLLWRQNSYRVSAEAVRDVHLAASGLLDRTIGRQGIRPPLPAFVTEVGRSVKWPESQGGERYRRGMYIFFKRTVPYPMLMAFDAPDSTVSCSRRERSNTPLQALTLLNDPVFHECAQALAREMARAYPEDVPRAVREMFTRCLARPPQEAEQRALLAAYEDLLRLAPHGDTADAEDSGARQAALAGVARVIMNLDEFITRD